MWGLIVFLIFSVIILCLPPLDDEARYQKWKEQRDKIEQIRQFEQRYQKEQKEEKGD